MSAANKEPLILPIPPAPMTPIILMSYLEAIVDEHEVESVPILLNGKPLVNATVVDGKVVLRTWCEELNLNPPCPSHNPVQHRDGKPPWCKVCRLTATWDNPHISRPS